MNIFGYDKAWQQRNQTLDLHSYFLMLISYVLWTFDASNQHSAKLFNARNLDLSIE